MKRSFPNDYEVFRGLVRELDQAAQSSERLRQIPEGVMNEAIMEFAQDAYLRHMVRPILARARKHAAKGQKLLDAALKKAPSPVAQPAKGGEGGAS